MPADRMPLTLGGNVQQAFGRGEVRREIGFSLTPGRQRRDLGATPEALLTSQCHHLWLKGEICALRPHG